MARTRHRTLQQIAEARNQIFQAYGVVKCLQEALMHGDETPYADAATVAMRLMDDAAGCLDSVNIKQPRRGRSS